MQMLEEVMHMQQAEQAKAVIMVNEPASVRHVRPSQEQSLWETGMNSCSTCFDRKTIGLCGASK